MTPAYRDPEQYVPEKPTAGGLIGSLFDVVERAEQRVEERRGGVTPIPFEDVAGIVAAADAEPPASPAPQLPQGYKP